MHVRCVDAYLGPHDDHRRETDHGCRRRHRRPVVIYLLTCRCQFHPKNGAHYALCSAGIHLATARRATTAGRPDGRTERVSERVSEMYIHTIRRQ